ncbi:hypothetical protein NDU88_005926 [Pleurodeles waltl]|uniref:Centromere protein F n=1 Tax=Pleurodeles waltl TaxID=8319 RepID=A0AAV7N0S7_PLEWA|nr:hypothetical protein NDU88_005926 [Pleurodeles waltl]
MSWTAEEWKVGLPSRALQKISEQERQFEKLSKEKQQKQLQMEALEMALHKQKQKYEEGRAELAAVTQEKQNLAEVCTGSERARQRLTQELQVKDAQVCSLQGLLSASKKEISSLEQELKRCLAELEKLQASGNPVESQIFLTPPWSCTGSPLPAGEDINVTSPYQIRNIINTTEQSTGVTRSPSPPCMRRQLQMSRSNSPLDAPQRRESPVFPWQEERSPVQRSTTPHRGVPTSQISWGQNPPSPTSVNQLAPQNGGSSGARVPEKCQEVNGKEPLVRENEELRCIVSQLKSQLQTRHSEDQVLVRQCQDLQRQLEGTRSDLAVQVQKAAKLQEELQRQAVQQEQNQTQRITLEQKLKNLSEELKCQRQNAEAAKHNLEQRLKQKEKEYQQDVSTHQQQCLALEQHHLQECTRLRQELQQAKNNGQELQALADKLKAQHLSGEKELEKLREAVRRAERETQICQSKVEQLQADIETSKGQELVPSKPGISSEIWSSVEDDTRRVVGKRSHGSVGQATACQILNTEKRRQEGSKETASILGKTSCLRQVNTIQNETGRLPEVTGEVYNNTSEKSGPTVVLEPKKTSLHGFHRDCDVSQPALPTLKKQCLSVDLEEMKALNTETVALACEQGDTSCQSNRRASAGALLSSEEKGQCLPTDNERFGGFQAEDQALKTELLELKLKLDEKSEESELRQKALFEARLKLKQSDKKYTVETGRLKKQVMELKEKLSSLEGDLASERCRSTEHQQASQTLADECRRLSAAMQARESDIQKKEVVMNPLQSDLKDRDNVQLEAMEGEEPEVRNHIKCREDPKEVHGLEGKATKDEEKCGGDLLISNNTLMTQKDNDMQVLNEKIRTLEEQLKAAQDYNKFYQDAEKRSQEEQTLSKHQRDTELEGMEQKVKDLKLQCETLSGEKLEAEMRASEMQDKFNHLQATINMQTQQLTVAFETQTQNIGDLLQSLEEKEAQIVNLKQTVEQYSQCMAHLHAENVTLLAAKPQLSPVKDKSSISEGSSDATGLENAFIHLKLGHLEKGSPLVIEDSSARKDTANISQEIKLSSSLHPNVFEGHLETRAWDKGEFTCHSQGGSETAHLVELPSCTQSMDLLIDPQIHLTYLEGGKSHQLEKQTEVGILKGDQSTNYPSEMSLLDKDVCLSPSPADNLANSHVDDTSGRMQLITKIPPVFTTVATDQGNTGPSHETGTEPLKLENLHNGCMLLAQESGMLEQKLLNPELSSGAQEAYECSANLWPDTGRRLPQKELGNTDGPMSDLEKSQKNCLPLTVKAAVPPEAQGKGHWWVLQEQFNYLQRVVAEAQHAEFMGAPALPYAHLQHQVDVISRMVSDLLDEKTVQQERLNACDCGGSDDQSASKNIPWLGNKSLTDPLEGGDCGITSTEVLKGDTKILPTETKLWVIDGGVATSERHKLMSRPLWRQGKLCERRDCGTTHLDVHELDSKVLVEKAWLWEIGDIERTSQEGPELSCRPLTEISETLSSGGSELQSRWKLNNGEIPFTQRQISHVTQLIGETPHTQRKEPEGMQGEEEITHIQRQEPEGTHVNEESLHTKGLSPQEMQCNGEAMHNQRKGQGRKSGALDTMHRQSLMQEVTQTPEPAHTQKLEPGRTLEYLGTTHLLGHGPDGKSTKPQKQEPGGIQTASATVQECQESYGIYSEKRERQLGEDGFETQVQKRLQERGKTLETQVHEASQKKQRESKPLVKDALSEKEKLLETMFPERNKPSKPPLEERLSELKRPLEPEVEEEQPERERKSAHQIGDSGAEREKLLETHMESPNNYQVQEGKLEMERPLETQVHGSLTEMDIPSEPQELEDTPETETSFKPQAQERLLETWAKGTLPETVKSSDSHIKGTVPENWNPSETCALQGLTQVRDKQSETKAIGRQSDGMEHSKEELQRMIEAGGQAGQIKQNALCVVESRTVSLQSSPVKESLQSHRELDKGMQTEIVGEPRLKQWLCKEGVTVHPSTPGDLTENHITQDSETPGVLLAGAELQWHRSVSLGSEDQSQQRYAELVQSYQALEETNGTLSKALIALQNELVELRGAERPELCHSETQTELLETTVNMEGQETLAWTWRENPADLVQRLQRQREKMSMAHDDTEYEPYGLPEVVMKGFADIPTGPACPYVLRRGLLGSAIAAIPKRSPEAGPPASSEGSSV